MGDKSRPSTSYTNTVIPESDKHAYGTRIGHFSQNKGKIFIPGGSYNDYLRMRSRFNLFSKPRKFYMYDRTVVPSIGAGEKLRDMVFLPNSMDFRNAYTRKELINTHAGDGSYFDRLLRHYDSVPKNYLDRVGLAYDRNEAVKYGAMRNIHKASIGRFAHDSRSDPPLAFADRTRISGFDTPAKPYNWVFPYNSFYGVNSNTSAAIFDRPHSASAGYSMGHELNHETSLYGIKKSNPIMKNSFGYDIYFSLRNSEPRLMALTRDDRHAVDVNSGRLNSDREVVLDDAKKFESTRGNAASAKQHDDFRSPDINLVHRLDPYDLWDAEKAQAIISFNRNKNLLKKNIKANRLNYMVRGFNPMHLKMVEMQPDFYTADEAGRKAFINDMNFYSSNPQMSELLGADGRRGVATYHNLTRESNRNFRVPTGPAYKYGFKDMYDVSPLDKRINKLKELRDKDMQDFSNGRIDAATYKSRMKNWDYILNEHNKQRSAATKGHRQQLFDDYRNDAKKLRDRFIDFRILGNNRTTPRPQYSNTTGTVIG